MAFRLLLLVVWQILACPCLPEPQLRSALREMIVRGAQKADGWGISQSLLETAFVRAHVLLPL